jgi:D-arabinose 1-dehydrogenase-like Zn-dependent alcohol dehydrogenase
MVGTVTAVGASVAGFAVGDAAGVGTMVGSCGGCAACAGGEEQFCSGAGAVYTYGSVDARHKADGPTQGGYSSHIVVDQRFALRFPAALDRAAGAPLLCAGITVYSPLRHFRLDQPGQRIGVVGLGGLGHMAVKFVKAFGGHCTVISTSPAKEAEAKAGLGADAFLVSKDAAAMAAAAGSLDGIIDTVSASHSLDALLALLATDGKLVLVGLPPGGNTVSAGALVSHRRTVAGSLVGGVRETQEMLDFCAERGIAADVEVVTGDAANGAWARMLAGDVRYRFVLDVAGTPELQL